MYTLRFTDLELVLIMLNTGTHSDLFDKKQKK